jgi:hypothetical protein
LSINGGGTREYFEHIFTAINSIDFALMKRFVNYSWFDLGGSDIFKISLTKKDKVYYGIENF